jgi:hypothetical protein
VGERVVTPVARAFGGFLLAYRLTSAGGVHDGVEPLTVSEHRIAQRTGFEDFERLPALLGHPICQEGVIVVAKLDDGVYEVSDDSCKQDQNQCIDAAPPKP